MKAENRDKRISPAASVNAIKDTPKTHFVKSNPPVHHCKMHMALPSNIPEDMHCLSHRDDVKYTCALHPVTHRHFLPMHTSWQVRYLPPPPHQEYGNLQRQ